MTKEWSKRIQQAYRHIFVVSLKTIHYENVKHIYFQPDRNFHNWKKQNQRNDPT